MTGYLVGYECSGRRYFVTKTSIHGNDLCRLFTSKRDAEQCRRECLTWPSVTDAYVIGFGT